MVVFVILEGNISLEQSKRGELTYLLLYFLSNLTPNLVSYQYYVDPCCVISNNLLEYCTQIHRDNSFRLTQHKGKQARTTYL